jgi:CHASE3 domain sensor protein
MCTSATPDRNGHSHEPARHTTWAAARAETHDPVLARRPPAARPFAAFGAALAAGVVLVNACASYWNVRTLAATHRRVVHTHEVITQLQDVLSLLKDAETGQRGYLLTGEAAYREPYDEAVDVLPARLARLKELTADNPNQQARFPELEARIGAKLDELGRALALRDRAGPDAALAFVRDGRGKQEMDAIRGLVAAVGADEQRMLERRAAAADRRVRLTLATIVAVSAAVLLFHVVRGLAAGRPGAELARVRP